MLCCVNKQITSKPRDSEREVPSNMTSSHAFVPAFFLFHILHNFCMPSHGIEYIMKRTKSSRKMKMYEVTSHMADVTCDVTNGAQVESDVRSNVTTSHAGRCDM